MKYDILKEYRSLRFIHAPMSRPILAFGNLFLSMVRPHSNKHVSVTRRVIEGEKRKISLYVFSPKTNDVLPVMFYVHGGGFVVKAAPYHYSLMKEYAYKANIKIVMIDYSLSPKYKYPIPLDDCVISYKWMIGHAEEFAFDLDKIIVGGDSAGGCLASALCLKAKSLSLKSPVSQFLIYPVLDYRMETESMKKYVDTPVWDSRLSVKMWKYYLGDSNPYDGYASPILNRKLGDMPKAYIELAEFDCLHDEGLEYHRLLLEKGVKSVLYETKGTCHGFELNLKAKTTRKSIKERIEYLSRI